MAVKIRLKRMGKIRAPFYRVVVMDSRTKRDGRAIEEIGKYHPTEEPSLIDIDSERAQYWLRQGAQPTEAVVALLKITGDWQTFKGLPGTEGTLKVKPAKPSKKELYEAAVAAVGSRDAADTSGATTPKKRAAKSEDKPAKSADAPPAKADDAASTTAAEPAAAEPVATEAAAAPVAFAAGEFGDGSAAPLQDGTGPEGFPIKGNKDSMKYHEPDGQWYEQTIAEVWFATPEAAEAAGFARAGG